MRWADGDWVRYPDGHNWFKYGDGSRDRNWWVLHTDPRDDELDIEEEDDEYEIEHDHWYYQLLLRHIDQHEPHGHAEQMAALAPAAAVRTISAWCSARRPLRPPGFCSLCCE